ncbi:hypothetical protein D9613_010245 [Agrocybe pediades]|uniref:7alpha-cephem-methoxylase P8 chain n=1 Tax=Agrocybe pediades TaxID=84607 RepID=A0A8H4QFG9_9AGAR|nr:hypothetical protein D9613_010245 [Agrocybe pediades]
MSSTTNETGPNTTTGVVSFVVPPEDKSVKLFAMTYPDPVTGERKKNYQREDKQIIIENLRGKEDSVSLDTAGFQFFHAPVTHKTFSNDEEIQREYYPESVELIKKLTGASRVEIFDHTVRRRNPEQVDAPGNRQPAPQAHVDQSAAAAVARVHRHLPESEAPELLKKRFQIINLWRPISHPAWDWPLALCDYRSVNPENDTVPVALLFPHRKGETLGVKYSPNQKWKYLYGMTSDEIVLIKCADSIQDGSVAVFTPHTAFEDPATPKGSPFRQSIELRALVFYD